MLPQVGDDLEPVKIRLASQTDLKGIYLIEDESFSEPYPHRLIANLLRDCPTSFFVAECPAGTIVGYCVAVEKGRGTHLISIGVLRECRRRGVGTALIRGLLANLSPRVKELRLEVKQSNREAIKLYEEMGFKTVDSVENYYEDGSAAIKMLLTIAEAHTKPSRSTGK